MTLVPFNTDANDNLPRDAGRSSRVFAPNGLRIARAIRERVAGSGGENARRMAAFVAREAREHNADLVVFPELATTGYVVPSDGVENVRCLHRESEAVPGPTSDLLGCGRPRDRNARRLRGLTPAPRESRGRS